MAPTEWSGWNVSLRLAVAPAWPAKSVDVAQPATRPRDAVIDGEFVARDAHGISRFQLLQNALRAEARLLYCIFDIMFCDGKDLSGLALLERKETLAHVTCSARASDHSFGLLPVASPTV